MVVVELVVVVVVVEIHGKKGNPTCKIHAELYLLKCCVDEHKGCRRRILCWNKPIDQLSRGHNLQAAWSGPIDVAVPFQSQAVWSGPIDVAVTLQIEIDQLMRRSLSREEWTNC